MIKLTVPDGIDKPVPVQYGRDMEGGHSYLVSGRFAGSMLLTQWRVKKNGKTYPLRTLLKVENWLGIKPLLNESVNWDNRDLWLCRGGGYGDLLALTPLIREINRLWPKCRVHVSCGQQYFDLFYGLNVIPELMPIPFNHTIALIDFEELIEGSPDAENVHLVHLFTNRSGIELENMKIHYKIKSFESDYANTEFPKTNKRRIAVQFLASALYRSYPKMQLVIKQLSEDNEVFIFGTPGQVEFLAHDNVTNLMARKLSFRQSAAVLATCDACVAPDSSLVHLCSALEIPCVALYGPIPSSLRVTGSKVHPIDGTAPCAPCFFHADRATDFPYGKPCFELSKCVALDGIPVETVIDKVKSIIA